MAKKRKLGGSRFPDGSSAAARHTKKQKPNNAAPSKQKQGPAKTHKQYHSNQEPVVPFSPQENILLIGEGDLSFAASLAVHHGCRNLTATVLEKSEADLLEKYPQAKEHIERILRPENFGPGPARGGDSPGRDLEDDVEGDEDPDAEDEQEDSDVQDDEDTDPDAITSRSPARPPNRNRILYNTDATTLKAFTVKAPQPAPPRPRTNIKHGIFDHIIFNFPHVGGKSTDVNRQVRSNQSLLVSFFERALPSLRPGPASTVVVTLFEGEPYTLWNVRDLGRHAGLAVDRSFRFPWASYPGYRHARTLGVVRAGGEDGGESKTAWRGEDRPARSYVFKRKDDVGTAPSAKGKKGDDSDSDSE